MSNVPCILFLSCNKYFSVSGSRPIDADKSGARLSLGSIASDIPSKCESQDSLLNSTVSTKFWNTTKCKVQDYPSKSIVFNTTKSEGKCVKTSTKCEGKVKTNGHSYESIIPHKTLTNGSSPNDDVSKVQSVIRSLNSSSATGSYNVNTNPNGMAARNSIVSISEHHETVLKKSSSSFSSKTYESMSGKSNISRNYKSSSVCDLAPHINAASDRKDSCVSTPPSTDHKRFGRIFNHSKSQPSTTSQLINSTSSIIEAIAKSNSTDNLIESTTSDISFKDIKAPLVEDEMAGEIIGVTTSPYSSSEFIDEDSTSQDNRSGGIGNTIPEQGVSSNSTMLSGKSVDSLAKRFMYITGSESSPLAPEALLSMKFAALEPKLLEMLVTRYKDLFASFNL